jgi:lysozyme
MGVILMPKNRLATSFVGIKLIKSFEGVRLKAYKDPVGIWTIGYGHIEGVFPGQVITMIEAEHLLRKDLSSRENHILRVLAVSVSQNQFDALSSFVFNVGTTSFSKSTLLRKLNKGDIAGAANEFPRWVFAGKQKLAGLVKRREAERQLFLKASLPITIAENLISDAPRIYGVSNPDDDENFYA